MIMIMVMITITIIAVEKTKNNNNDNINNNNDNNNNNFLRINQVSYSQEVYTKWIVTTWGTGKDLNKHC